MQTAKNTTVDHVVSDNVAQSPVKLADADADAITSPAAQLREQLHSAFDHDGSVERWSYRRTAAFLMVTSGGFWACVAGLASYIL